MFYIFCVYTFFVLSSLNIFSLNFSSVFRKRHIFHDPPTATNLGNPFSKVPKNVETKKLFQNKKKVENDLQKIMRHELEILDDHCKRKWTNILTFISFLTAEAVLVIAFTLAGGRGGARRGPAPRPAHQCRCLLYHA
jgi:hypothetical protein